jgi:hypothetical protein
VEVAPSGYETPRHVTMQTLACQSPRSDPSFLQLAVVDSVGPAVGTMFAAAFPSSNRLRHAEVMRPGGAARASIMITGLDACLQSASVFSGRNTVFPDSGLPAALVASPGLAKWDLPPAPARALLATAAAAPQDERWEGVWEGCGQAVDIFE